ncbi:MAG: hypothetical protein J1E04_05045, partial [Alistipes sp.]|nr:hypothetical protein [Alistipes sp.]
MKSLLMSATLLMSGAMISCQADKDDDPVNFGATIKVTPDNVTANLGDTVHFTLDSNTDWTLVIANEKHQLLVEDALYSGKKGDGQDVWVKIASDLEEGSWVPGTKI